MKLFLTSFDLAPLPNFIGKNPSDTTIGFIATAADLYEDKWFVEKDRKFFVENGYKIIDVDIKDRTQLNKLQNVAVIYIAGGNTFYLLEKAIESGALQLIKELVIEGKLYAGGSAGAVFAGPNIEPVALLDDPNDAPNLKTYEALGLVDFVVLPHYGKEKHADRYKKIMEDFKDRTFKLITLRDDQAIIVDGDSYKIIDTK